MFNLKVLLANPSSFWLRFFSLCLFLLVWAVVAAIADSSLLPGPGAVAANMVAHLREGDLVYHTGITLARVVVAFVVSMIIGTVIGVFMGHNRTMDTFFDGWLVLGLNIPALVIIILCYIWFGLTEVAVVVAVAINKIPLVVVTVREGARAVDRELLQVAQVYRLSRARILFKTYLPQLYPYLMAAARSGLSLIWKIVLVVELLGRSNGVGFQLHSFFQFFDIASILAYTLAFVGVILFFEMAVLRPLELRLTRWRL